MTQEIDTAAVDPAEFARNIGATPDAHLEAGMRGELRKTILDEVFRRMTEHARPDRIDGVEAVLRWRIGGRDDGDYDRYEVVISAGEVTFSDTPRHDPRVTFTITAVRFLKLVTGNANGPALYATGKLKIKGDVVFAAQLAGLFSIPDAR